MRLSLGYKNRSVTRSFGIVPFIEQNLLGGSRYNFVGGFNADFSRRLSELAADAERGQYVEALSGRPHRRPIRQPYAAGGRDADVFRAERLTALRRCGLVAQHDERGGTGFRPQGFACRRSQNVRRRAWVCGQTCAIPAGCLTHPGPLCTASRAKTTNIRQTCRCGTTKSLGRALRRNSISAI
ncbi:hypothetical protein HHC21_01490 [Neisseria meningitidis]|nr:hypothetical protein [Neisseria meningitidis]MBW3875062.1 hypothetical protein [Neisseria meningitidis]